MIRLHVRPFRQIDRDCAGPVQHRAEIRIRDAELVEEKFAAREVSVEQAEAPALPA